MSFQLVASSGQSFGLSKALHSLVKYALSLAALQTDTWDALLLLHLKLISDPSGWLLLTPVTAGLGKSTYTETT